MNELPVGDALWYPPHELSGFSTDLSLMDLIFYNPKWWGAGLGNKIAVKQSSIDANPQYGIETIIHEYLHKASSLGLIKTSAVSERYQQLQNDPDGYGIAKSLLAETESVLKRYYGGQPKDNLDDERIAFLGVGITRLPWRIFPDYLHQCYQRTLKKSDERMKAVEKLYCPA